MLISRGLRTLLLGVAATASVLDRHVPPTGSDRQRQLSPSTQSDERDALVQGTRQRSEERLGGPRLRRLRSRSGAGARWTANGTKLGRLQSRQDSSCSQLSGTIPTCPAGFACCVVEGGRADCCPVGDDQLPSPTSSTALVGTAAVSTVFITQTLTSTVTLFTGSPTTGLVTSTNTIVITLLNPTQQTQTATVTATSFVPGRSRAVGSSREATSADLLAASLEGEVVGDLSFDSVVLTDRSSRPERNVEARQEQVVTSTITSQVLTTVLRQSIVLATLTNTVFSTTFVAPNAVTTVFVTTTVFVPSGAIPSTEAPTATIPTIPNGPSSAAPTTTTGLVPPSTRPSSSLPTSAPSSPSSIPPPTSLLPPTSTQPTMTMETMQTSINPSTTTTSSTPSPTVVPTAGSSLPFTVTQIVGIVVGGLIGTLILILLAFGFRRIVRNRRSAQAQMRQQLPSPEVGGGGDGGAAITRVTTLPPRLPEVGNAGGGGGALATNGSSASNSSGPSAHSILTGEGEVRIVIRPAPKRRTKSSQLWPMPPGHRGRTYSLFVEEATTTGETTPQQQQQQDPGEWSIASERGSVRDDGTPGPGGNTNTNNNNTTTIYSTNNEAGLAGAAAEGRGSSGSGGRPSTSVFSAGWDRETTSFGARSEGSSYPGLGTLLTPPPAWHGHAAERGWPAPLNLDDDDDDDDDADRNNRGGTNAGGGGRAAYLSGSLGIGKAV